VREQATTRIAARNALHLGDGQELVCLQSIRKIVAPVIVPGNNENIAADALRHADSNQSGRPRFHQLDKLNLSAAGSANVPFRREN